MAYQDFIEYNIAPYIADHIGVYDLNGNRVGEIELGNFKPEYGERLYRFGVLSDVHHQSSQTAEPAADFKNALEFFNNKESVAFTCICGDITENGTAYELSMYRQYLNEKSPTTPVYTCAGNHDATYYGLSTDMWTQYTGNQKNFEISYQNDIFLFLSMTTWSLGSSGTPYSSTDIDWLESKLNKYKNKRVFIFTHLFFPTRAGNLNDIYPSGNWLGGTQLSRLQGLNDRFKNAIWFSGHSHWKWYLQKYQDRANIYKSDSCGYSVHIPSCASPIDSDGTSRVSMPLESEGAIVDVYENYIDIRGIDLKNKKYLPIATYRLDTRNSTQNGVSVLVTWEPGSIRSATGLEVSEAGVVRTVHLQYDSSKYYYLNYDYSKKIEGEATGSIACFAYDSNGNFISKVGGNPDYICDENNVEYPEASFSNYYLDFPENTATFRLRVYAHASSVNLDWDKQITDEYLEIFNEAVQIIMSDERIDGDDSDQIVVPEGCVLLTEDHFTVRSGTPSISTDEDGYINITFTATGQKFWIKTPDMTSSTTSVELVSVEDVICEQATDGIGFYSTFGYYWMSGVMELDYDPTNGVQFNISGSKFNGTVPITIKFKNAILKCYN